MLPRRMYLLLPLLNGSPWKAMDYSYQAPRNLDCGSGCKTIQFMIYVRELKMASVTLLSNSYGQV